MNICISDGCSEKPIAKNLCRSCYNRQYREGRLSVRSYKKSIREKCGVEACPNMGNVSGPQKGLCLEHARHAREGVPLRTLDWSHEREDGSRQCRSCGTWVSQETWSSRTSSSYRNHARCNRCIRDQRMRSTFGITQDQYEELLEKQGGRCAGCGAHQGDQTGRSLSVDHDHECCPGSKSCGDCVRGLLCVRCNVALGYLRDDVETLKNLTEYLERNSSHSQ